MFHSLLCSMNCVYSEVAQGSIEFSSDGFGRSGGLEIFDPSKWFGIRKHPPSHHVHAGYGSSSRQ